MRKYSIVELALLLFYTETKDCTDSPQPSQIYLKLDGLNRDQTEKLAKLVLSYRENSNNFWSEWNKKDRSYLLRFIYSEDPPVNKPERKRGYDDQGYLPDPHSSGRILEDEYEEIFEIQDLLTYRSTDYEEQESDSRWQDLLFASALFSVRKVPW